MVQVLLLVLITYVCDPFYQYHQPYLTDAQPFYDRDHQVPGSVRTSEYDSILLGSSVAENFDTSVIDAHYNCTTLKVVRASGSTADLLYYLEQVHDAQTLTHVFWCMDIFALNADTQVTLYSAETPRHLHTATILDDFTYLLNKDILFQEIPQNLAFAAMGKGTGGNAYNWAENKTFSAQQAMRAYAKPTQNVAPYIPEDSRECTDQNLAAILSEINSHPQVQYTIFFPPYSMIWWDCGYTSGISDEYFYTLEKALPALAACPNVDLHYFQAEQDIICDLDNYMDMIHYAPEVNQFMLDGIFSDSHKVLPETVPSVLADMESLFQYIISEGIYLYY